MTFLKKLITNKDYNNLLKSLSTITSLYSKFLKDSKDKALNKKFRNMFYHLRAGTYDIETKDISLFKNELHNIELILNFDENVSKILAENKLKKINKYFAKHKFDVDALDFIKYSLISMKLQRKLKFIFTRTLSDLLEIISFYGRKYA